MQERRGQLGRGLVCLLAANGLFGGSRQKTGRSFAAYGTISTRRRVRVVGNPGVLRVLPAPGGLRVQERGGCHLLSVFFSLSDDVCKVLRSITISI